MNPRRGTWLVALLLIVAACSGGTVDDVGPAPSAVTQFPKRTTIPVVELGAFDMAELEQLGVVTARIIEWVVLGEGRYVAFTQPASEQRGARVRVLDRSRAKVRTVDADLGAVGELLPAGGDRGVAYLALGDTTRSIAYVAVDGDPVDLVTVLAGTTRIEDLAVAPNQSRVVWRELRRGGVQVLASADLDGGSVVLDESEVDGMIGEGVESPIVLTDDRTVVYFADPEGDGDATWYAVPIDGGEARPTDAP